MAPVEHELALLVMPYELSKKSISRVECKPEKFTGPNKISRMALNASINSIEIIAPRKPKSFAVNMRVIHVSFPVFMDTEY